MAALPELLAPAGDARALQAALAAGADAVYFGLESWSARAFAGNFAGDDAVAAIAQAHRYGARAYVALNTQLRHDELEPALAALQGPYEAGLDALILADLGLLGRVRAACPDLPVHASTQMNTHSSAQLAALAKLGCRRAILARELSLSEIAALRRHGLELEVFVHGALCYGYSGDCLLSSMVGGRSGNRGRCSQSCRLRYSLERPAAQAGRAAGAETDGDKGAEVSRVLSTADLCAIDALPQLLAAGVTSLKIEGRMKDAAYVGVTTAVYREALDAALADPEGYEVRPEWRARLEQSFSRGFTAAHLESRHDAVRSGGRGGNRGVLVGRVAAVDEAGGVIRVRLNQPVSAGDVVSFFTTAGQTEPLRLEQGGEAELELRLSERVAVKDRLFRLAAGEVSELAQALVSGRRLLRPLMLTMRLRGALDALPVLTVSALEADGDEQVEIRGVVPLAAARTAGLTAEKVEAALGALGGTPYRLAALSIELDDGLFLPVAELKELRRRAIAELDRRREQKHRRSPALPAERPRSGEAAVGRRPGGSGGASGATDRGSQAPSFAASPALILHLRPGEKALTAPGVAALCLDVETAIDSPAAVLDARRRLGDRLPVWLRLPEVLFDDDEGWWRVLLADDWAGIYVGHLGVLADLPAALPYALEYPLQGLNAAAAATATAVAGRPPSEIVASPESSLADLMALAAQLQSGEAPAADGSAAAGSAAAGSAADGSAAAGSAAAEPPAALGIVAFGRQRVLRARDRVGAAEGLLAAPTGVAGADGCDQFVLRDVKGYEFPLTVSAAGSRLLNARLTNLAPALDEVRAAGVSRFHVIQADLAPAEAAAFATGGLGALAPFASRERSTTGHLFRGVA